MDFFNYEYVKELVVYSCFGAIMGCNLAWIGYGVARGVKWLTKKLKNKKSEAPDK